MALTVRFFKNVNKKTNSTFQPSESNPNTYTDFSCTLKDGTSILDPVFDIYLSFNDNPAALGYNYCKVPALNRYYFVRDWRYSLGVWTASCSVDVLASYKTEIGSLTKYVLRSASNYDPMILDNCMTKLPPDKVITPLTNAGQIISPFTASNALDGTNGSYIVGIQGPQPVPQVPCIGGVCYYLMTYAQMKELLDYLTSSTFAQLIKDDAVGLSEEVVKMLQDPSQYIVSCMWFPWTITRTLEPNNVQPKIGFWNTAPLTTGTTCLGSKGFKSLTERLNMGSGIAIPSHPQEAGGAYGSYLRAAPYSLYKFHFEPWGDIEIDGSFLADADDILCDIEVDLITGTAALDLYAMKSQGTTTYIPLSKHFAQVGVSVGIAQLIYEMQSMGGSLAAAGASVVKDLAGNSSPKPYSTFDPIDAIISGETTIKDILQSQRGNSKPASEVIQNAVSAGLAYMASPARSGVNGNYISYLGFQATDAHGTAYMTNGPYLEATFFTAADANNTEIGRPLRQSVQINTLSGYVICAEADADIPALAAEKVVIGQYLTGGFFYE